MESPDLCRTEVERAFVQTSIDLNVAVTMDGIDSLVNQRKFRIHCHDLYGDLPDLLVAEGSDSYLTMKNVRHAACKIMAITHMRSEISRLLPEPRLLPRVIKGKAAIGGMKIESELSLAEVDTLLEGYRHLTRRVVGA